MLSAFEAEAIYFPHNFPYDEADGSPCQLRQMTFSSENPFDGTVPPSVLLPDTPLTGVLVQIKFPEVLSISKTEFIAGFQEEIRADYPLSQQDRDIHLLLAPEGANQTTSPNWRFFDATRQWRMSLTTGFFALETRAYKSRQDFTQRIASAARALSETINPGLMTRIGVRYVDRVHGALLNDLEQYVRPEVLGIYHHAHNKRIGRTLSEVGAETIVGLMTSRWGFMPAGQTHEPDLMPPIAAPSWFLDIDVYQEFVQPQTFDPGDIETRVMDLATRVYGFFRWVVSDNFLRACGGKI